MNRPSWKLAVDRQSSEWLDGDQVSGRPGPPRWPWPEEGAAQEYIWDLLFVDALFSSMSEGAVAEREARIRRVMDALPVAMSSRQRRARMACWSTLVAVAACLIIAAAFSWLPLGQDSLAQEVLLAVHKVSTEATDRIYTIRRLVPNSDDARLPAGRLYLRGREGFVITWADVVLGRNQDQFWLVAPDRQVTLSHDFQWIDAGSTRDQLGLRIMQELSLQSRQVPLMQLASVAELMEHDYLVTCRRGQLGRLAVDLLVGQRRTARDELPVTIRLWAGTESRVIHRAELSWGPRNAILLELDRSEPVAAGWYRYQAHCDGEPTVRHISLGP